mmetsp:Transcript_54040/g.156028  ORF Transcript_54040/g.156028 Transcript_54040/m.156028 type:complete len:412 (-) Transcript_54040:6-1241(-)
MKEIGDLFKVRFDHHAGRQGGGSDTDSTGGDGGSISRDAVLIQSDADFVTSFFELASGDSLGLQVPQDQVVFCTSRGDSVSVRRESGRKCLSILLHLLRIQLEFRGHDFLQLSGNSGNLVFVGPSLQGRENSLVDLWFEITLVLSEEDHTSTGSTKRLVRGGGDDIAEFERRGLFSSGNQTRNVGHIHHQQGTVGVGNLSEFGIVPVTRVRRSSANDQGRLEQTGITSQLFIVNVSGFGVDAVGKRLEVDRGGRDSLSGVFLLRIGVESVGQVTTTGQIQSHDTVVWSQQGGVNGKVSGGSRVRLDVYSPLFRVQSVRFQGALLTKLLNLVNYFISSVITSMGKTLSILIGKSRSQAVHDGLGGEVLRSNQFQRTPLTGLFLLDQIEHFRVMVLQILKTLEFLQDGKKERR